MRRIALLLAALLIGSVLPATSVSAQTEDSGTHSDNIEFVGNLQFPDIFGLGAQGTDSDFIDMDVEMADGSVQTRQVGVFGSIGSGPLILDVTDGDPVQLAYYPCSVGQGDVQLFQRDEARGTATYMTYADDGYARRTLSAEDTAIYGQDCVAWAQARDLIGFGNGQGTYIIDITDPRDPQPVNFVSFPKGTHNQTLNPQGTHLYNSNSELITNAAQAGIEIYDITDLQNPIQRDTLPLIPRPGLGTDAHDITFNAAGDRAYAAALSQTVIIDTTNPDEPSIISSFMDAQINVEHQANLVEGLVDPLTGLTRDYLIVEDEFAGAAGAEATCPSGGVHIYDVTDELELAPVKVGYWNISDLLVTDVLGSCTAHVFEIYPEAGIMTMSFYNGGIRVIDIRSLVGLSSGSTAVTGMREIGFQYFDDSNSWSVKAADIEVGENGELDFFLYSDDINRGVDTFHFTGNINDAGTGGDVFMNAAEANAQLPFASLPEDYRPFCLLGAGQEAIAVAAPSLIGTLGA